MTITIKREGLKLSLIGGDFPARGSSDVPIQLQSDGSYSGYMITPQFGWYQNGAWKEAAGTYDDGIKLPAQMYRTSGYCYLALALAQTGNAGHVEVTNQIQIPVPLAPHGSSALPDEPTMQEIIENVAQQYYQQLTNSELLSLVYPVGSIYTSVNNTNPGSFLGGTWVSFGAGRTLIGVNSSDNDFSASQKTGGAKQVTLSTDQMPSHTHSGSTDSGDGNHNHNAKTAEETIGGSADFRDINVDVHNLIMTARGAMSVNYNKWSDAHGAAENVSKDNYYINQLEIDASHSHQINISNSGAHTHDFTTESSGGSEPIDILPPYITVYFWRRTA